MDINEVVFRFINSGANHFRWLDFLMIFFAQYSIYILGVGVLVILTRNNNITSRKKEMAILALGSAVIARFGLTELIRWIYYHPRPYWILENTNLLLGQNLKGSFPSGHTMFAFALATGVYLYDKKSGRWFYLLASIMAIARIFVGAHWPFDIIAGMVLGIITALVCNKYYRKYKHKFL